MRVTHVNDSGILALSRQSLQKITLWKKSDVVVVNFIDKTKHTMGDNIMSAY